MHAGCLRLARIDSRPMRTRPWLIVAGALESCGMLAGTLVATGLVRLPGGRSAWFALSASCLAVGFGCVVCALLLAHAPSDGARRWLVAGVLALCVFALGYGAPFGR